MKTHLSLGEAKAHHALEEYYEKWEKLRASEQRAYAKARKLGINAKAWLHWERTAKRLKDWENQHNTN